MRCACGLLFIWPLKERHDRKSNPRGLRLSHGRNCAFKPGVQVKYLLSRLGFRPLVAADTNSTHCRTGAASDLTFIQSTLWAMRMNPTGLTPSNFIVAEERNTADTDNAWLGFGQIRPAGAGYAELARYEQG